MLISTLSNEVLTIMAPDFREALRTAYRAGYEMGYTGGRVAEMKGAEWDAVVPWEKEKDAVTRPPAL